MLFRMFHTEDLFCHVMFVGLASCEPFAVHTLYLSTLVPKWKVGRYWQYNVTGYTGEGGGVLPDFGARQHSLHFFFLSKSYWVLIISMFYWECLLVNNWVLTSPAPVALLVCQSCTIQIQLVSSFLKSCVLAVYSVDCNFDSILCTCYKCVHSFVCA